MLPSGVQAAPSEDSFLRVSRILTGSEALSAPVAARIRGLLAVRNADFDARLTDLAAALQKTGSSRAELVSRLSDAQVTFALSIAKPWYLGYVGKPSNFVLKDDAAFATFLETQSFQKVIAFVPCPTYPNGNAGSWAEVPKGVDAPPMPAQIRDWTFHPGGPAQILAPDPRWKRYATEAHASLQAARSHKPAADPPAEPAGPAAAGSPTSNRRS